MPRTFARSRHLALAALLLGGASPLVSADVLLLAGGGRLEGILIEESPVRVTLEVSTGRVTLPRNRVARIERTESALAVFRARLGVVSPTDAAALIELGRYAAHNGLGAEARLAFAKVLALDPGNAEAHRGLGHILLAGSWMEPEEAYRAQGLVPFEGRWVTPLEQAAQLRERERRTEDDRRLEDARRAAREAEDRARRAEAEASRARAEANRAAEASPWGYRGPIVVAGPGWAGGGSACLRLPCDREPHRPVPAPTPAPRPQPTPMRPTSIH